MMVSFIPSVSVLQWHSHLFHTIFTNGGNNSKTSHLVEVKTKSLSNKSPPTIGSFVRNSIIFSNFSKF